MADERVPVVLVPRFSTSVGNAGFMTLALDVQSFSHLELFAWRGPVLGAGAFSFSTVESIDRGLWSPCFGPQGVNPPANTEIACNYLLTKKWLRLQWVLGGSNPAVTWWAQGFFIRREK